MIKCTDECGREIASPEDASQAGWTWLEITGRYRCPTCHRELVAIMNYVAAASVDFVDMLPKESLGALVDISKTPVLPPVVKADVREDDTPE